MKVYIIGHNGWIGERYILELTRFGHEVLYSNYRAESEEIKKDIIKQNPTHILYCAGRTHGKINNIQYNNIDYLENPETFDQNINDNLYAPVSIAIFAKSHNIHFTYINTGCIYNYDDEHSIENKIGFKEDDTPNFKGSKYSMMRSYTDKLMNELGILNLRIRLPISDDINERNLIIKLSKFKQITNILNSVSVLPDLIPISIQIMDDYTTGCLNLVNSGPISHNDILELYREIVNPNHLWELVENPGVSKVPRSNVILDNNKINKYNPSNTIDAIRLCLNRIRCRMNYIQ
jgi:3,5-epimerase/4-reductase